jgi:hypothetical protein
MLTHAQLERLCALVYLNEMLTEPTSGTLGDTVDRIGANGLRGPLPALMTEAEWRAVLLDVQKDTALRRLQIMEAENITQTLSDGTLPGHRAFALGDGNGYVYAVFRGTGSDEEWRDNAYGMTAADTPQQKAAARFAIRQKQQNPNAAVITAGHSKGGNKAQYAAVATPPGVVSQGLSVDGQGFSPAFMQKYENEIASKKDRIHLLAERRDLVNGLGLYLKTPTQYYSGWRDGYALPYFHCPDALRDRHGRLPLPAQAAPIPEMLNALTVYFLLEPKYESTRSATAVDLVSLMMNQSPAGPRETAQALVNLVVIFLDLAGHDPAFRTRVAQVLLTESRVLVNTFDDLSKKEHGHDLRLRVVEQLTRRVVLEPQIRKDFHTVLQHLRALMPLLYTKKRLYEYIDKFIAHLLTHGVSRVRP